MTMTLRGARFAAATALVALVLPLSGCIALSIPEKSESTPDAVATPDASPTEPSPIETIDSTAPMSMSFADGDQVSPDTLVQWGDGLMFDDGWNLSSPDNGQGSWGYTTTDDACTASFYQGFESSLGGTSDREATLAALELLLDANATEFEEFIEEGQFSYQVAGSRTADYLSVYGSDELGSWTLAVRAFAQTSSVLYVDIECSDGSLDTRSEEVYDKNSITIF